MLTQEDGMSSQERFTFLVAGEAGHGVRLAGTVAGDLAAESGRHVFQLDDYQSLIRGGHNFSVVTSSPQPVLSQYLHADLVVALDKRSYEIHRNHLSKDGILVYNSDVVDGAAQTAVGIPMSTLAQGYTRAELRLGVASVVVLLAAVGFSRDEAGDFIRRKYVRDADNNVSYGLSVYDAAVERVYRQFSLSKGTAPATMLTGNEAIGLGMYAGGLDMYFAYPMTPSSSILHYLASRAEEFGITVVHPESEIAVINLAIGAASVGARAAVGSSGGGLALMEEGVSLAGMSETPVLCVLSSRMGPSTGVPTYTAQGDLSFALNQGHGEFPRIVASPGTVTEAYELAAELMGLAWAFQTPAILLTEKHLSESRMTVNLPAVLPSVPEPLMSDETGEYRRYENTVDGISPLAFAPSDHVVKWTSYEHDEAGITTEDASTIALMQEKRLRKREGLVTTLRGMRTATRFGSGKKTIVTYGSTAMSVREAVAFGGLDMTVVQPVYLEPFPTWEFADLSGTEVVVVEQSCSGQLAALLERRTGVRIRGLVTQYDGRPFDPEDLAARLKEVLADG
jgi:2-oxoglutarate/2-oxoacid ferredoxin oxidoreductase subunit alpha